jgi:hypothetical protein
MVEYDKWLLGKEIPTISLDNSMIIYSEEPIKDIQDSYTKAVTGIEVPPSELII